MTKPAKATIVKHIQWLFIFLITIAAHTGLAAEATQDSSLPKEDLLKRLQQGGLIIYFRHFATDRSQEDQHPVNLTNCATQRNLSEEGRSQSAAIGTVFKRHSIPVSEVISSPFCRCKESAEIAFGKYGIDTNLYFAVALEKDQREQQTSVLLKLLTSKPDSGNRIVVSHTANLREATGLWPKPEGVAYVFQPTNNNKHHLLGIIKPDQWAEF